MVPISDEQRARLEGEISRMTQVDACAEWRFGKSGHPFHGGDKELTAAFHARFEELGGFTPAISKLIGWAD